MITLPKKLNYNEKYFKNNWNSTEDDFEMHIKQVFNEYSSDPKDNEGERTIPKINFYKYMQNLPIKITERLFIIMKNENGNEISYNKLAETLTLLKFGNQEQLAKLLFSLFDFDKDGDILLSDLLLILFYLPSSIINNNINNNLSGNIDIKYQLEKFKETFKNQSNIGIHLFKKIIFDNNNTNNILMIFLIFLFENIPIFKAKIKKQIYKQSLLESTADISNSLKTSLLDVSESNTLINEKEFITQVAEELNMKQISKKPSSELVTQNMMISPEFKLKLGLSINIYNKNVCSNSNSNTSSPNNYENFNEKTEVDKFNSYEVTKEGYFYVYTFETEKYEKLTRRYIKVINNNSINHYNEDDHSNYIKTNLLIGCFIKKKPCIKINDETYWCFELIFANEKRKIFYNKDQEVFFKWVEYIRWCIDYRNIFDNYEMTSVRGEGGQGKVLLSKEISSQKNVAIKVIEKKQNKKSLWIEIKTEIDIMRTVNHPNIINFIDDFHNSEYSFIVMEYIKYGSLQTLLANKKTLIKEKTIISAAFQIAKGIKYLHSLGIVHRDIKPSNILIDSYQNEEKFKVKITDFGLSKILGKFEETKEAGGTLYFIPPEALLDKITTRKVDIWSFGVTIYFALFSKYPFKLKKLKNAYTLDYDSLSYLENLNTKSEELRDLLTKCFTYKPEDRIEIDEIIAHPLFKNLV